MASPIAISLFLGVSALAPGVEREQIDILLPLTRTTNAPPAIRSARMDWWSIRTGSILSPSAAATVSPIVVVLDFLHSRAERPECLVEEILPVLQDPAYKGRLRVLALGGPAPYFQNLRSRYRAFQILDFRNLDASRIHDACRVPMNPPPQAEFLVRLARALGYSTTSLMQKWDRFQDTRTALRTVVGEIPAKGAPARIFWLAGDFQGFNSPPVGCDGSESEDQVSIAPGGNCGSGGLVDRDLLYFSLSEITHAGAVITPILMNHNKQADKQGIGNAKRVAAYTGAPVIVADQHPSRALWNAIRQSDGWPLATLSVPVVGMRAVITQPRKLTVTLTDGTKVERRFATKEGQVFLDNLALENPPPQGPRLQRYAGSNPIPLGVPIPSAPVSSDRAVLIRAGSSRPAWLLPRVLSPQVDAGCGSVTKTTAGHTMVSLRVAETHWSGTGAVEVILRGTQALAQSLTATRAELQAGVCFGLPPSPAGNGYQIQVVDPETGSGGVIGVP